MRTRTLALLTLSAAALAGCRSSETEEDEFLSAVEETELITPSEASARAEAEITPENVDEQLEALQRELEREDG